MGEQAFVDSFASDMVLLRQVGTKPLIVHGGGPQIGSMLSRLEIESSFVDGLRVTDEASISIVEMVLAGGINKSLVAAIAAAGGKAVGISVKMEILSKQVRHIMASLVMWVCQTRLIYQLLQP